jgi:O-glycosyl hydrolase
MTVSKIFLYLSLSLISLKSICQSANVTIDYNNRHQVIDGFGAHQGDNTVSAQWWLDLFFKDAEATIYRVDLTPRLKAPYSNLSYYSPWFMGSGTKSIFNLEDTANPNGPENNRVRTYTGPNDYSRVFGGQQAPIAVMGPDINDNISNFVYAEDKAIDEGVAQRQKLGDFKLIGSLWSPVPWVKESSGNSWSQDWWPGPVNGAAWPFIWGGNFAGGKLDVSGTPLAVFNDASLGGNGNTSSLTQFARSSAAYISGYQKFHNVKFYAISIQNELNFEQFYNSMTYPLSSQYIKAVTAIRAEFDKYADLKDIKIMGPEDLLGGDAYGMWEYGSNTGPIHKNLQLIQNIEANAAASKAVDFYCIHGYANDGVNSSGSAPTEWQWWTNGWQASPAPGIPANVKGINAYNKKSWMTETSGENPAWLFPTNGYPNNGGFSITTKIHQALTVGNESAWVYWTFTGSDDNGQVSDFALSNQSSNVNAPKYVAAKHFFKYIRPNSYRVNATSSDNGILASAYIHDTDKTITAVIINTTATSKQTSITINQSANENLTAKSYISSNNNYWNESEFNFVNGSTTIAVPAYGVVTIHAKDAINTGTTEIVNPITNFDVWPNPTVDDINITYTISKKENIALNLFDNNAKLVFTDKLYNVPVGFHKYTIPTKGILSGMYLCEVKGETESVVKKVVVLK